MSRNELIIAVLKAVESGNEPNHNDYDVTKDEFGDVVEMTSNEGLLENATVQRGGIGNKVAFVHMKNAKITMRGLKYLEENS